MRYNSTVYPACAATASCNAIGNMYIVVYFVFIMLLVWLMVVKGNAGVNVFTAAALMLNDLEVNDNDPQRQ